MPAINRLPLNDEIQKQYQLTVDSYTGFGGFYDGSYITKYLSEDKEDYANRREYTEYTNQISGVVNSLVSPIFSGDISRIGTNDYEDAFIQDCDGKGTSLDDFMEEVGVYHKLLGNVFIVMDNDPAPSDNLIEAIANREYPYVYYKIGTEVECYSTDKRGKLTEISFYYESMKIKNKEVKVYQHIDAGYTYRYYIEKDERVLVTDKVPSASNGLPVIMTGTTVAPVPVMYSLAAQAKLVYNKGSELRLIERTTNMSILQMVGIKPEKGKIEITNVAWVDEQATKDMKFISPDPNIMKGTLDNARAASEDLTNIARSLGAVPITEQAKSGVAYAYEFQGNTDVIKSLARTLEHAERSMWDMFATFFTNYRSEILVDYPMEYTPGKSQLKGELEVNIGVLSMNLSQTLNKSISKRIAYITDVLGGLGLTDQEMSTIETEIEQGSAEPVTDNSSIEQTQPEG